MLHLLDGTASVEDGVASLGAKTRCFGRGDSGWNGGDHSRYIDIQLYKAAGEVDIQIVLYRPPHWLNMAKILVRLEDDIERELRAALPSRLGGKKGALSQAANQAFRLWLDMDTLKSLFDQANGRYGIVSDRKDAIETLAEIGGDTNPELTKWMLAKTAENPILLISEKQNARRLLRTVNRQQIQNY